MLQSKKDEQLLSNSYVDGVPVKISEQYKPPRRITLPVSCQNGVNSEALHIEYDFKLENSVINKLAKWKKTRQEEAERRKERLKLATKVREEIERVNKLAMDHTQVAQAEEVQHATQILNPVLSDSVLTPVCAKQSSPSPKPVSSRFNFSDFESDNSSPFDNMELKTINDMEVLASILTIDNTQHTLNNNNIIGKDLGKNGLVSNNKKNEWGDSPLNSYNNYVYSSPEQRDFDEYGLYPVSENYHIYNYALNDLSNQFSTVVSTEHPTTSANKGSYTGGKVEAKPQHVNFLHPQMPSSNVTEIVQDLENDLKEWRSNGERFQTETIAKPCSLGTSAIESWNPWPDLESPKRHEGKKLSKSPDSSGS